LKQICSDHILFEENILSQERGFAQGISFLKRIFSGHILFEEDMLSQERICSPVAKYMQWTYPL
jgi:hypothetical protein